MRKNGEEFFEIVIKIFCVIILCVGFYNLFVNIFHQNYINQTIRVNELDRNYSQYKENVNTIKDNLQKSNLLNNQYDADTMKKLYSGVNTCLNYLQNSASVYGIKIGQLVKPYDVYQLNSNFSNELYNHCWLSGMGFVNLKQHNYDGYLGDVFPNYNRTIKLLVDNSDYVKKELAGNSSYHYRTVVSKNMVRNDFVEQYDMVLYNYRLFSDIIVEISDYLVRGDY